MFLLNNKFIVFAENICFSTYEADKVGKTIFYVFFVIKQRFIENNI